MATYTKVLIILKDAPNHTDFNKRIIEYLNDRHIAINDNMFTLAIDVVDNSNINKYVSQGMGSVPALRIGQDDEFVHGVNSILAMLAKLEIIDNRKSSKVQQPPQQSVDTSDDDNAFYNMALAEMNCDVQEDPDKPSSIKTYNQDFQEAPLTEKLIEEKSQAYNAIFAERNQRNKNPKAGKSKRVQQPTQPTGKKTHGLDVDKFIKSKDYGPGEEMMMRQFAQNL